MSQPDRNSFVALTVDNAGEYRPLSGEGEAAPIARFNFDPGSRSVRYELLHDLRVLSERRVVLRGFAPPGWEVRSEPLALLSDGGVWSYTADQEPALRAGLAYVEVDSPDLESGRLRAQVVEVDPPLGDFPEHPGVHPMAGGCHGKLEFPGSGELVDVEFEPAQVQIVRGSPEGTGKRVVRLNVDIRVGSAFVPGLGSVAVEVMPEPNPGTVVAQAEGQDFPADMTLRIRKRYITPLGNFVGDVEEYKATGITSFPPFGARLEPMTERVRLVREDTGEEGGYFLPGTVTPLFPITSDRFPLVQLPPIVRLAPR